MAKRKDENDYSHGLGGKNRPTLATLSGVRKEMCRMYRRALTGKLPTEEATRFTYILREIRVSLETEAVLEIQQRMAALEARLAVGAAMGAFVQRNGGEAAYARQIEHS